MHPALKIFAAVTVLLLAGCNPQPKRGAGEPCLTNDHCLSGSCHRGMCGAKDPVGTSQPCLNHGDCKSYLCSLGLCLPGTGAAGSACLNHEECGSVTCSSGACAPGVGKAGGRTCGASAECAGKVCHRGVCLSMGPSDVGGCCQGGWACKSFRCQGGVCLQGDGAAGSACFYHEQCVTAYCEAGSCAANPCPVKPDGGGVDGPAAIDQAIKVDSLTVVDGPLPLDQAVLPDAPQQDQATTPDIAPPPDLSPTPDATPAPVVTWKWTVAAGGVGGERPTGITTDSAGNAYVTGTFMNTATFGAQKVTAAGLSDFFVARLNANKTWAWVTAGGAQFMSDWGMSVALAPGGQVHVAGFFGHQATFGSHALTAVGSWDAMVTRVSASGAFTWVTPMGGFGDDTGTAVAVDSAGNSYVTGHFTGAATFGTLTATATGSTDVFVIKADPTGKVLWLTTAGGAAGDYARSLALTSSGELVLSGTINGQAKFGATTLTHAGGGDIFVACLSKAGVFKWATSAGGAGFEEAFGMDLDGADNATLTGTFSGAATFGATTLTSKGSDDVYVLRVDSAGKIAWATAAPSAGQNDWGRDVACTTAGVCYVTGTFTNGATFGPSKVKSLGSIDAFVAKINGAGVFLWGTSGGGTGGDSGYSIALTPAGEIFVAGEFSGTATFGSQSFTSAGTLDAFVALLAKQ